MKVIFLDFDGVINNNSGEDNFIFFPLLDKEGRKQHLIISIENLIPLKRLFDFIINENIYIVLSTSWRIAFDYIEVDRAFKELLGYNYINNRLIIGAAPITNLSRGLEINDYIKNNDITDYLIVDDIYDFEDYQEKHLIQTNYTKGLTLDDLSKIQKYFKGRRVFKIFKGL